MLNWKKVGLIYKPNKHLGWSVTHCQLPTIIKLSESKIKIYFASRDSNQISSVSYIVLDLNDPKKIIEECKKPILEAGPLGNFDQDGVYPSSIIKIKNKLYLYYIGWTKGNVSPLFNSSIGLAISKNEGKSFFKFSNAPILDRSKHDPCLVTAPVIYNCKRNNFEMIYISGFKWKLTKDELLTSLYDLKYAFSSNGIHWNREGKVILPLDKKSNETNFSRPAIFYDKKKWHMWFGYKNENINKKYCLGYASSLDGKKWIRNDNLLNFEPSFHNFDNEMMAYPSVVNYKDMLFMFYNGNNFGREGLGLATSYISK